MSMQWEHFWKDDWDRVRERMTAWWWHDGLVVQVLAPREGATNHLPYPQVSFYRLMSGLDTTIPHPTPGDIQKAWLDPVRRAQAAERFLAGIFFGGEAIPFYDTQIGPGNLAMFLGSEPEFFVQTVWYKPCITDTDSHPPLRFAPDNAHFLAQKAILQEGMRLSQGRYLVGMPDLVENVDTLASLRDTQTLMMDMIDRPDFVKARVAEINQVYFAAFEQLYEVIRDPWGGNVFSAFNIWGPGKTAKVQCDSSVMFSPEMFAEFVAPCLSEQCQWLDYAMYHLDGTQAVVHLDQLLQIDALDAIEWTPQAGKPQGGSPQWYSLYRRILDAGKSVQAINVRPEEVLPLLDAIGTRGVFIMVNAGSEAEARTLVESIEVYR